MATLMLNFIGSAYRSIGNGICVASHHINTFLTVYDFAYIDSGTFKAS